jgi:hypothetical protein
VFDPTRFLSPLYNLLLHIVEKFRWNGWLGFHPVPTQPHNSDFNEEYHNLGFKNERKS